MQIYCSMTVVMIFELTQRDLIFRVYDTPRLLNTKWINVELLRILQGLETILLAPHMS